MTADIATAAQAYRAERSRYWIRRCKVGEVTSPGGSTAIISTLVELEDGTFLRSGSDEDAKAWLDTQCIKAAIGKMLSHPSDELIRAAGSQDVLRSILNHLAPQE